MNVYYDTPQRTRQSCEKRDAESFKKRYIKIHLICSKQRRPLQRENDRNTLMLKSLIYNGNRCVYCDISFFYTLSVLGATLDYDIECRTSFV